MLSHVSDDLVGDHLQDIESHGLGEGSGLADDDDVSLLDGEGGGDVHWDVGVLLLVPVVLVHVVQIVPPDDDGPLHLGGDHQGLEDSAPDGHLAGEGALLVHVVALDGFLGGLESQPHILVVPDSGGCLLGHQLLGVEEDVVLLLEGSLLLS